MAARGARVVWASGQMGRRPWGRRRWGRGDGRTSTPSRIPLLPRRRRRRRETINRRTIWTLGSGLRGGKGRHPRRAGRSRSRRLRRRTYRRSSGASTSTTCWTASSTDEISERSRRDSCECNFCPCFFMFGIDGFRSVKMEGLSRFGPSAEDLFLDFSFPAPLRFSLESAAAGVDFARVPPFAHSALPKSCLFGNPIQRGRRHSSRSRAEGMVTQRKGSSSPARPRPGAIGKTSPDSSPIGASPTRLMRIVHLCPILVGSARDRSPL